MGDVPAGERGARRLPTPYATKATRLGALAEKPLEEFPVLTPPRDEQQLAFRPDAKEMPSPNGAVVPVWLTVKVPATVKAGTYTGTVKIEAEGEKAVEVPVEVRVADWTLPDTQEPAHVGGHDPVSGHAGAGVQRAAVVGEALGDDRGRRSRLIGETGSRTVYIPLIAHTNLGNEESMVRWVKKGRQVRLRLLHHGPVPGRGEKNMGKPKLVIFVVWDVYMMPADVGPTRRADASEGHARRTWRRSGASTGRVRW